MILPVVWSYLFQLDESCFYNICFSNSICGDGKNVLDDKFLDWLYMGIKSELVSCHTITAGLMLTIPLEVIWSNPSGQAGIQTISCPELYIHFLSQMDTYSAEMLKLSPMLIWVGVLLEELCLFRQK